MVNEQKTRDVLLQELAAIELQAKDIAAQSEKSNKVALDGLVEKFVKTLEDNRFSLKDVKSLLYPEAIIVSSPQSAEANDDTAAKHKLPKGVEYKDPKTEDTWTSGKIGARPKWIKEALKKSTDISHLEVKKAAPVVSKPE